MALERLALDILSESSLGKASPLSSSLNVYVNITNADIDFDLRVHLNNYLNAHLNVHINAYLS